MSEIKSDLPDEVKNLVGFAKKEGHSVFSLTISGVKYIYRSISRSEFRKLQEVLTDEAEKAKLESDKAKKGLAEDSPEVQAINSKLEREALLIRDRGEDRLVAQGLIWPPLSTNTPAGVITTIADRIMEASGWGVEAEPEIL
jgi:hypothetical protein